MKNLFNKNKTRENWCKYKTKHNHCIKLLYKTKIQYYKSLDIKEVTDSKKFWKSVKSHFGKGDSNLEKIMLENNLIKTNEKEIATIINTFFINITINLDLKSFKKCTTKDLNSNVSEFGDHISIKKIKESFPDISVSDFNFETVTMEDVKKEILNLNITTSSTVGSIPATILKQSLDTYLQYLKFSAELKHSEVIPLFKKKRSIKEREL